jgi:hypothetical protein
MKDNMMHVTPYAMLGSFIERYVSSQNKYHIVGQTVVAISSMHQLRRYLW